MHSTFATFALCLSLLSNAVVVQGCESHGVDFQSGGSYFQNISSVDPFTFVSIYENCEKDVATNILVDPNGDEHLCSDTPLQPDDTEELSTCPLQKDQMFSGDWMVLILSNNGDGGDPIAYMRDFELIVGTPVTTTYTPTISVTVTSTPLSTTTSTTKTTTTNTVTSSTVLPAKTKTPTKTITPAPVTTTKTFGPTIKLTATEFAPIITTKTVTKTCKVSTQTRSDPTLTWRPNLLPSALSGIASALDLTAGFEASPPSLLRRVPAAREQRIAERKERLANENNLHKRAPDSATTTLTNTNSAEWATSTSTSLAPTSIITATTVLTSTAITTSISTVYSGTTTLPTKYITLATRTITKLKPTIFTTTVATVTKKPVFTITLPKIDPQATKVCKAKGGEMVDVDGKGCTGLFGLFC